MSWDELSCELIFLIADYISSQSYPSKISGLNKTGPKYKQPGYLVDHPIIPHGMSVALTGPSGNYLLMFISAFTDFKGHK